MQNNEVVSGKKTLVCSLLKAINCRLKVFKRVLAAVLKEFVCGSSD
jgi:hypothetical protein